MDDKAKKTGWSIGFTIVLFAALVTVVAGPFVWHRSIANIKDAQEYNMHYRGQDPDIDPWGNEYRVRKYHDEGMLKVVITSAGPDGQFGTRDDMRGGYVKSVTVEIK